MEEMKKQIFKDHIYNYFVNNAGLKEKVLILNLLTEVVILNYKCKPGNDKLRLNPILKIITKEHGRRSSTALKYLRVMRNDLAHMNTGFQETFSTLKSLNSNESLKQKVGMLFDLIEEPHAIKTMYVYWVILFPEMSIGVPKIVEKDSIEDLTWF